jgi:CheY-like chemotaxis protein
MSESRGKVLVIDDSADDLEIYSALLYYNRFDVLKADNGLAGIAMAARERPDVIVCDIRLTDVRGQTVAEIIKSNPETRHIGMIAMSATDQHRAELRVAGFETFFMKPIKATALVTAVDLAARQSRASRIED